MDITAKLWSYCHILRHDGVDYVDYIEQLTYLLFLKMAEENSVAVPAECKWETLLKKEGEDLKMHYDYVLQRLKNEKGILGQIFQEPLSKIKNPASLKKIIDGIETVGWTKLNKDVQGEAFEGLLEKTANEGKKGAGQFFTPRPLIQAIVHALQPNPLEHKKFRIADTSCGTAGFLTVAVEWAKQNVDLSKWNKVRNMAYYGQELVVRPFRLALMNLFLHGVIPNLSLGDSIYGENYEYNYYSCVLTNPPFGTRGVSGPPKTRNFDIQTSNIQINFVQHIYHSLQSRGRAAIVLPDSALSDKKARELWRFYIGQGLCNVHTILKLPRGTFTPYANGVKACVVFFQKGVSTTNTWVYDARTNVEEIRKSSRPLNYEKHFANFIQSYGRDPNGGDNRTETERFQVYSKTNLEERNYDLLFTKVQEPVKYEQPLYYVERLIKDFERQLVDLHKLKKLLQ